MIFYAAKGDASMKKIIAFLLCAAALFALCACGSVPDKVYYVIDESGSYTDSVGNNYEYSYKLPAFSGGSEDAERINKRLDAALRPIIEGELEAMKGGVSLMAGSALCDVYENGDITSVLVSVCYPNDYVEYYTASMNIREGREMNNKDLAAILGVEEYALPDALRAAAAAAVQELYAGYGELSGEGFADVNGFFEKTMAKIGSDEWNPTLFINGEGKLCMICEVMSPVGRYNQIFTL